MSTEKQLSEALEAAFDKKARNVVVLDLEGVCSFTDHFIICDGASTRHNQSIADGVAERLRKDGVRAMHIEGYSEGEWILMDFVDFVVHIFSTRAREFYDLERLWRAGQRREIQEPVPQRS